MLRTNQFIHRILTTAALVAVSAPLQAASDAAVRKLEDIVIYSDEKFYSAFPSIVRRPDGELIVAFRRAPERRAFGESATRHTDPNSYLVQVRSKDSGKTWTQQPELIFANPFGGSQDPCLLQLRDKTLLCSSYGWAQLNTNAIAKLRPPYLRHGEFVFLGGFILRSSDGGHSWKGPFIPPHVPQDSTFDAFGEPTPAYNRGAMCEGRDGRIYWVVAANREIGPEAGKTEHKLHSGGAVLPRRTGTHLLISADKGKTWDYSCPVALDDNISFNETSLYETPKGDLVAFMRTADHNDQTVVSRSVDGGKSFQPWQNAGFRGHPHHALRLPDNRVLLVYGYRHAPFGIRARVLDPECTRFDGEELVLRDNGGSTDLGYPWATMVSKDRALVVYYFNEKNGTRHIAGTFLEIRKGRKN